MPLYTFENTETGETWDDVMSIASKEQYLKDNPSIRQLITGMNIVGGHGDRTKADGGMKEVFSKIAEAHPNSALADTYGKKDKKSVFSRELGKKLR